MCVTMQATAALGVAFGMRIIALRRDVCKAAAKEEVVPDKTYGYEDATPFFAECDFTVCTLPATAETAHFVSDAAFAAMKETVTH